MKKILSLWAILALIFIGCTGDVGNPSGTGSTSKITKLQDVIDNANEGDKINLAEYKNLNDYNATVNKKLTIYTEKDKNVNNKLTNSTLTISAADVEIVSANYHAINTISNGSKGLKIANSSISQLTIGGSAEGRGISEGAVQEGGVSEGDTNSSDDLGIVKIIGDLKVESLSVNSSVAIKVEASNEVGSNIEAINRIAKNISVTFHCLSETSAMFQLQLALSIYLNDVQINQDLTIAEVNQDFKYYDDNYRTTFGQLDSSGNKIDNEGSTTSTTVQPTTSTTIAFSQGWPTTQIAAIEAKHNNFGKISDVTCNPPGIEQGCYYITDNQNYIYVFLHNIDEDTASTAGYMEDNYKNALMKQAQYEIYEDGDGEDESKLVCSTEAFKVLQEFNNTLDYDDILQNYSGAFAGSNQDDVTLIAKMATGYMGYTYSQLKSADPEAAEDMKESVQEALSYFNQNEDEIIELLTKVQRIQGQSINLSLVYFDNTDGFIYNPIEINEQYEDFEFDSCYIVGLNYAIPSELTTQLDAMPSIFTGNLSQKLGWIKSALSAMLQ